MCVTSPSTSSEGGALACLDNIPIRMKANMIDTNFIVVFTAFIINLRGLNLRIGCVIFFIFCPFPHCYENLPHSPAVNIASEHVEKEEIWRCNFAQVICQLTFRLYTPEQ